MEEMIYVGNGYGRFKLDDGNLQDYCNVFVLEDFVGEQNADYHYAGHKAVKYKCTSPDVFKDIPIGARVLCSFNRYGRISSMQFLDKK